ncbi:MAG: hypothetical protein R3D44_11230 [Hyphomicrobiaceae bacterium]
MRLVSVLPPPGGSSGAGVPLPGLPFAPPRVPDVPPVTPEMPKAPEKPARSLDDYLTGKPEFAPIEGLDAAVWQQPCASCHKWTPARLCEQGKTYVATPTHIERHPHPYGGALKSYLKSWAENGCK